MLAIEWQRDARRIILPVLILAPAPASDLTGIRCNALVDTGSTTSGITRRVAESLGLSGRGKRPISSARGEDQAERFLYRIGFAPGERVGDTPRFPFVFEEIIGFELTNAFQFEALLGMDILRQCDFTSSRTGNCSLRFG